MGKKVTLFLIGALSVLAGCAPDINNRGYELENRDFAKIIPGSSNRQFVEDNFGSPTTVSPLPPETWYYISKVTSSIAFLSPKTLEEKSYAVVFDQAGIVMHVLERKGEEVYEINPIKRTTPAAGHQPGLLREIFSNFGKIATQGRPRRP